MEHYTLSQMQTDHIYLEKKKEEDCVELAIRGLEVYVHGSEKRLIKIARTDKIDGLEAEVF